MTVTRREVEDFVYLEARLADEHCYDDWLSLWTDDATYWVPANRDDIDPTQEVSIIYDDRQLIGDRVDRLKQGLAFAQDPESRMRRIVSNIEFEEGENGETRVYSNFVLFEIRRHIQNLWAGRTMYMLRQENEGLKMALKKVMLVNNDEELPALEFLL